MGLMTSAAVRGVIGAGWRYGAGIVVLLAWRIPYRHQGGTRYHGATGIGIPVRAKKNNHQTSQAGSLDYDSVPKFPELLH